MNIKIGTNTETIAQTHEKSPVAEISIEVSGIDAITARFIKHKVLSILSGSDKEFINYYMDILAYEAQ